MPRDCGVNHECSHAAQGDVRSHGKTRAFIFRLSSLWPECHSHSTALCGRGGRPALPPPHMRPQPPLSSSTGALHSYKACLLYGFDFGVNSLLWLSKMSLKFSEMNSNSAQHRPFSLGEKTKPQAFDFSIHSSHSLAARTPSPPHSSAAPSQLSHPSAHAPGAPLSDQPAAAAPPAGAPRRGRAATPRPERPLPSQRTAARRPTARIRRCATAEGRAGSGRPRPVA